MKTKKIDRIGFTLPSGITFWYTNNAKGIHDMIDMLNRYDEMNHGKVFNGAKATVCFL